MNKILKFPNKTDNGKSHENVVKCVTRSNHKFGNLSSAVTSLVSFDVSFAVYSVFCKDWTDMEADFHQS